MGKVIICTACFLVIIYMKHILTLQVIPERAKRTYINEKYAYTNGNLFINRHGRKSKYYMNIEGTTKVTFGNNVTLNLIFLEKQQNEYKQSFIQGHFRICETLSSKEGMAPYIASAFRNAGFICPLPPGLVRIMNISVPADNFPNVWPFERCKIEASLTQSQNNDIIATAELYLYFKQTPSG